MSVWYDGREIAEIHSHPLSGLAIVVLVDGEEIPVESGYGLRCLAAFQEEVEQS
jgi:hypothetical protein